MLADCKQTGSFCFEEFSVTRTVHQAVPVVPTKPARSPPGSLRSCICVLWASFFLFQTLLVIVPSSDGSFGDHLVHHGGTGSPNPSEASISQPEWRTGEWLPCEQGPGLQLSPGLLILTSCQEGKYVNKIRKVRTLGKGEAHCHGVCVDSGTRNIPEMTGAGQGSPQSTVVSWPAICKD